MTSTHTPSGHTPSGHTPSGHTPSGSSSPTGPTSSGSGGPGRRGKLTGWAAEPDRKRAIISALLLVIVIGAGVGVTAVVLRSGARKDTLGQLQPQSGSAPRIIPLPDSGTAPTAPGDRGGWQQLATLAVMCIGLGVIGVLAFYGSRKARATRAAWRAAADEPAPWIGAKPIEDQSGLDGPPPPG